MTAQPTTAASYLPARISLKSLRDAARHCRACPLWKTGTQTVFGQGPAKARILMVGEQPGDREDTTGLPFVGPAGRVLDDALLAAGLVRSDVYVTNAVKHFKWAPAGKRRLHQKPTAREIAACRPWLEAELQLIRPEILVALGATAAQALRGPQFRVTRDRGQPLPDLPRAGHFVATLHPSAILRMNSADRDAGFASLVSDLRVVSRLLQKGETTAQSR